MAEGDRGDRFAELVRVAAGDYVEGIPQWAETVAP